MDETQHTLITKLKIWKKWKMKWKIFILKNISFKFNVRVRPDDVLKVDVCHLTETYHRFYPKKSGGSIWPNLWFFKTFFRGGMKLLFFVSFNIIISGIFPENVIEIPQIVQKIWKFSLSILIIFDNFSGFFWGFLVTNKLMTSVYNRRCQYFFTLNLI